METQFNINLHYYNLSTELYKWYGMQGFDILNQIFSINLFDYKENELEDKLDELRDVWGELPIDERVEFYNIYKH